MGALAPITASLQTAAAQRAPAERSWSVALRAADLDHALRDFSNATGAAVAYDPENTRGLQITCGIRTSDVEAYLACLLTGTGLEFFRRASGTYVIGPALALPATFGLLAGRVGDALTDDPVRDAHVVLKAVGRGSISGPQGQFVVPDLLPGRYAVAISHLAFGTWTDSVDVLPGGHTRIVAHLPRRIHEVDPVVVEYDGTALSPLDAPERMESSPAGTGVALGSFSDMTSHITIQGAAEGDLSIRLDGHPVYLPRQMAGLVGPFAASAIDEVRVHNAGFGADAGSSLGGVLDFGQALRGSEKLEVFANPLAVEASVRLPGAWDAQGTRSGARGPTARLSGRISLTNWTQPAELERSLRSWSRTDPFVLVAPIGDVSRATEEHIAGVFQLSDATPALSFTDLHASAEAPAGGTGTWTATAFHGRRGISADRRRSFTESASRADAPLISSAAAHHWATTTASLGWRGLRGTQTFLSLDARASAYRYRHEYVLAEGTLFGDAATGVTEDVFTSGLEGSLNEGNRLDEFSLSGRAERAVGQHFLSSGLEVTSTTSRFDLRLASIGQGQQADFDGGDGLVNSIFLVSHNEFVNHAGSTRLSAWLGDRFERGSWTTDASVRLTLRPETRTVYAEPRLRTAWRPSPNAVLALSGGLFRQFVNQLDYSTLNAGEIVPSIRIWLPIDQSARPPRALHAALDGEWQLATGWRLAGSVWAKQVNGAAAIDHSLPPERYPSGNAIEQGDLLVSRDLTHLGAAFTIDRRSRLGHTRLTQTFSRDRMQSDRQFGGREVSAPWSVPFRTRVGHRADFGRWSVGATGTLESGMRWALNQSYYDYFGHALVPFDQGGADLPQAGSWDLSDPDAHTLPPRFTVDTSLRFRTGIVEVDLSVQNLLDRKNEIDQRLLYRSGPPGESGLAPDPRYLPGRTVLLGVRLSW